MKRRAQLSEEVLSAFLDYMNTHGYSPATGVRYTLTVKYPDARIKPANFFAWQAFGKFCAETGRTVEACVAAAEEIRAAEEHIWLKDVPGYADLLQVAVRSAYFMGTPPNDKKRIRVVCDLLSQAHWSTLTVSKPSPERWYVSMTSLNVKLLGMALGDCRSILNDTWLLGHPSIAKEQPDWSSPLRHVPIFPDAPNSLNGLSSDALRDLLLDGAPLTT